ncbi:ParB/RepB/Spo0J family partition protein [Streptomyces minutiscleroticus]|uniref:Plasmid partitioning protein n=1 Tax=Streptomyces minutiscleroticus TaxID=68238 RepID=A0A918U0Y2_9ACTN|nr:ParB/RepB/Spo0J family partition protein [Streptomyces minutiscleroticus]GGX80336.1 plasmid partitioning protein [Streptomyces minutiscleroticus]
MSVADRLGTGSSFSHAPRGRSARGRAKAITQGDVPAYELVRLHLNEVSPTPLNPRRNFGTDEEKTRFGEELRHVQLAACVAVSRDAYLALWPEHADRIGNAAHVLVNGERRYHSASHVGLEALDFVVRDDLAKTREEFINYLLQENLEREDFDVIERARGVQQLVEVCSEQAGRGARARAAERLGKDRSWVTNQLALLELPDEIQAMLSAGSLPERDGRALARYAKDNPGLDAAGLLEHLKSVKEAAARAKADERAQLQALRRTEDERGSLSADNEAPDAEPPAAAEPATAAEPAAPRAADDADSPGTLSADNNTPLRPADDGSSAATPPAVAASSGSLSADNNEGGDAQQDAALPKQQRNPEAITPAPQSADEADSKGEQAASGQPKRLPYDNAPYVVHHLYRKMDADVFTQGARVWMQLLRENHPEEYNALLQDLAQPEQQST